LDLGADADMRRTACLSAPTRAALTARRSVFPPCVQ